jgi:lysophospholipase L1-like esterase
MNKLIVILFLFSAQSMAQKLIVEEEVKFLALGDSYTIGESVLLRSRWPVQLTDSLNKLGVDCHEPRIIAKTGWRTDNLKAAIVRAKLKPEYNLVSLLIGVNNYYQGKTAESYAPEFEELLKIAIDLAAGVKSNVFVLSIPDYGYTPFGKDNQEGISAGIDAFNAVNKSITEKLGVRYIPITDISRKGLAEPDLVASDGLHPSEKMYAEWVARILTDVKMVRSEEK